jgi:NitT/TauT family transport system substrate-binding protein
MRMRVWTGAALALAIALTSTACGGDSEDDADGLTTVRYGLPTSSYFISTVGVQYALQNGFFEDEGLNVVVTPLPGATTAIRAMLSGEQDIVNTGGDTGILAWQNGAPIKIINSPVAKGTDVLIARSEIQTIEDLAGGRFAISDPGSTGEVLGRVLLERNGVDPDTVQFVGLGSPADRVRAMIGGQVDATAATILILEPVLDAIANGEMRVLTSFADEFPDIPLSYNVTTDSMIAEESDVLVRFLHAEIRGYRWAQENPEAAAAIAVEFIEDTPLELLEQGMQGMSELGVYGLDGGISPEGIGRTQQTLVDLGQLADSSEPDELANFDLVQQAVDELGS